MTELFSSTTEEILAIRNPEPPSTRQMLWEGDKLLSRIEQLNLDEVLVINGKLKSDIRDFMKRCGIEPLTFNGAPIKDIERVKLVPVRALSWIFNCQAKLLGDLIGEDYEAEPEREDKDYDGELLLSSAELG